MTELHLRNTLSAYHRRFLSREGCTRCVLTTLQIENPSRLTGTAPHGQCSETSTSFIFVSLHWHPSLLLHLHVVVMRGAPVRNIQAFERHLVLAGKAAHGFLVVIVASIGSQGSSCSRSSISSHSSRHRGISVLFRWRHYG